MDLVSSGGCHKYGFCGINVEDDGKSGWHEDVFVCRGIKYEEIEI